MRIRPAEPRDFPAIAAILRASHPPTVTPLTAVELEFWDNSVRDQYQLARTVAEIDGEVVGMAHRQRLISIDQPGKFYGTLAVDPAHQRHGIGTALYDHLLERLQSLDPIMLRARCRVDVINGVRFLRKRGYEEHDREWESFLVLETFDPKPHAGWEESLAKQGITVSTLSDLRKTSGWERPLYDLVIGVQIDMPVHDAYTPFSFEFFMDVVMQLPKMYPDGYFIARDGDRLIGLSILERDLDKPEQLSTDDTGVLSEYRRRGIATALKLQGIGFARQRGFKLIRTFNDVTNRDMLAINERLGFSNYPPWIGFLKRF